MTLITQDPESAEKGEDIYCIHQNLMIDGCQSFQNTVQEKSAIEKVSI